MKADVYKVHVRNAIKREVELAMDKIIREEIEISKIKIEKRIKSAAPKCVEEVLKIFKLEENSHFIEIKVR